MKKRSIFEQRIDKSNKKNKATKKEFQFIRFYYKYFFKSKKKRIFLLMFYKKTKTNLNKNSKMMVITRFLSHIATVVVLFLCSSTVFADGGMVAYYKVGSVSGTIPDVAEQVKNVLQADSFEVIGEYNPANNDNYYLIAFTREDLKQICIQVPDRGIMAAIMKVALAVDSAGNVEISLLNPDYLFYSYLRQSISEFESELSDISMEIKLCLRKVANEFIPYEMGNTYTESDLKNFRFMVRDPSFSEPVVVAEFPNFGRGLQIIRNNLAGRKSITFGVYEMVFEEQKIAVFGVGLLDPVKDEGEAKFLEMLGITSLSSLPYELVLSNHTATTLSSKYRFPLFYPGITMNEFRKVYRVHRGIEEIMKSISRH